MQMRSTLYKKILTELDMKRMSAQRDMHIRREEMYKAVPEIEEIDRKINLLGIEAAKNTILNPDNEAEIAENLKQKTNELNAHKNAILKANGFSEDFLKLKYSCEICKDTGFVDGKMCRCFSQRLMDLAYNFSGLGAMSDNGESFENFNLDYYPPEFREKMQAIYNASLRFAENADKTSENLFFYGSPGLGKTHLCTAIAKEAVKKGCTVMYVTAPKLFREIEDEHFNNEDKEEFGGYMQDIMDVDIMIIDDLGTEFVTAFTSSELFNIINSRIIERKSVIISTNFSLGDIKERYGDRISSRIIGDYSLLRFAGDDIRKIKRFG